MLANCRAPRLFLACALPLALLAACGDDAAEVGEAAVADDGREASGEILPSSISDDMIATDRLDSQPPLMQDEPETGASTAADGSAAGEASDTAADDSGAVAAEAAPEPPPSVEDVGLPDD